MKTSLAALAGLCGCGIAAAQSTVTLFGITDAAFTRGVGSVSSRSGIGGPGLVGSRIGFRGTEDLGDGYNASFWLEAGIRMGDGNGVASNTNNQSTGATVGNGLMFNRRSTVSLGGPYGEVRAGRDYVPQYYNLAFADPFNHTGAGAAVNFTNAIGTATFVRASNGVHYLTPQGLPFGLYAHVAYYQGLNPSNAANKNDGNGQGIRIGFSDGPFSAGIGSGKTEYIAGDMRESNAFASWKIANATLYAGISRDKNGEIRGKGWSMAGTAAFGQHQLKASYSGYKITAAGNPEARKVALGYQYDLSKRSAVYTTIARVSNAGGAKTALNGSVTGANESSRGLDVGIHHKF